ncbi:MAG TPA: putative toxin-antitoxin system toxin component, PIN family [Candidatus Sulfotelmatobacter sp.]|nr:putative toxin-antitoxin system toxin component, PIN family [Candidatus Sulfotelmatobacter sp.]
MIRAVLDTNVRVSAMISSAGNEALLVLAINHRLVKPCFSAEILQKYSDVLLRPKFGFPADEVDALLALLRRRGDYLRPVPMPRASPDPGDDKFIACARAGKVGFLVTGNKRHFPESQLPGTRIVNAGELLEFITLEL